MKRDSNYHAYTNTETEIMEQLWKLEQPCSLKEITSYLNTNLGKNWKQQTVGTYLSKLQKKGVITIDKRFSGFYLYYPACTKEEFLQECAAQIVEDVFDNSLSKFVAAFTGGKKISEKEAEDLKKLI